MGNFYDEFIANFVRKIILTWKIKKENVEISIWNFSMENHMKNPCGKFNMKFLCGKLILKLFIRAPE